MPDRPQDNAHRDGDRPAPDPTIDEPEEGNMMTETRTIDDALTRFQLINGAGDGEATACVMTAISWVAGEAWTDHPPCSHRLLANLAIRANDADGVTAEQRAEIVKAGATGLLDTWWVPTEVVLAAIAAAPKDATPVDHALAVIGHITAWKAAPVRERPNLRDADLGGAYLGDADLRGANLRGANLGGANLGGADLGGANLRDADLGGANLRDADLRGANLRDADLGGANLVGARANQCTRLPAGWSVVEGLIVPDKATTADG